MKTRALLALTVAGLLLAGLSQPVWAQCAMCKTVLQGSPEGRNLQGELNRAILLMLVAPYVICGVIATVLFRRPLGDRALRLAARFRR
jgi:hypothetical protein